MTGLKIADFTVKAETKSDLVLTPEYVWYDEGNGDGVRFGHSVSSAGDVNGDGYTDAIVGSPNYKIDDITPGAVFLYLGGVNGLEDDPHQMLTHMIPGVNFGVSVSIAGDINHDGFDDVVIGSDNYKLSSGTGSFGAAFIYYGSSSGLLTDETNVQILVGVEKASQFGYSVSGIGDVNGDTFDDVLIGAIAYTNEQSNEGAVYLYKGSENGLDTIPFWQFENNVATSSLGYAISGVGDLNKDGFADFAVGAPYYDLDTTFSELTDEGIVYFFLGSGILLNEAPDWSVTGSDANDHFGSAVAGAGDVDKNGYSDVLIGSKNLGAAYLFYNEETGLNTTPGWSDQQPGSRFGFSVAGLGDVNYDGYPDIAVGAPYFTDDHQEEGAVFVYCGGINGVSDYANWVSYGNKAETEFGYSVAAGDFNKDNRNDLLVGSPIYRRDDKTRLGAAFSYHGMASGDLFYYYTYLPLVIR